MKTTKATEPTLHPAERYMEDVLSGRIVVNQWVKLAAERQKRDLERAFRGDSTFPFRFDRKRATKAINFYKFVRHSKGEWAGQIIQPAPWQQFIEWCVYGWVHVADGTRRFRTVYEEVARKNGKTTRQAKNGVFQTLADGEDGAEVYVAATKLKQSMACFDEARRMVLKSPSLKKRLGVLKYNINYPKNWSKFEPLGQDSESIDGLNVSCGILDELHAHKNREIYDLLDTATGSRRQPLIWSITTAGKQRSGLCWDLRQYSMQVLKGTIKDESWFGIIFCIDDDDDPFNEACWIKANPNLGISVKLEALQKKALRAKHSPLELSKFLRLHLGVWTGEVDGLISEKVWSQNAGKPDFEQLIRDRAPCFAAFDISAKVDLTALVLLFPPYKKRKTYDIIPFFWIPEESVDDAERPNREMIKAWVKEGYIQTTPGKSVKQKYIFKSIIEHHKRIRIREVLGDEWNAAFLIEKLIDRGLNVTVFGQNIRNYTEPTKKLLALALDSRIRHGGHPVLAWNATNLCVISDTNDNIMPTKKKSAGKIDGIVGVIMALGGYMSRNTEKRSPSGNNRRNCSFDLEVV